MSSRQDQLKSLIEKSRNQPPESDDGYGTASKSDSSTHGFPSQLMAARGRARLITQLMKSSAPQPGGDSLLEDTSNLSIGSRGRFVQNLMSMKKSPSEVPKPSSEVAASTSKAPPIATTAERSQDASLPTEPVIRTGESGTPITLTTNFMKLKRKEGFGLFLYTVDFEPTVDSKSARYNCVKQNAKDFGESHTYSGDLLMLSRKLKAPVTTYTARHPHEGTVVRLEVTFRGEKRLSESTWFYNNLFKRLMGILQLTTIARGNFDPSMARIIPHQRLEVWPGFVTAVNEFEGGLMLNLDVSHRVLMQTTVYDQLKLMANADRGRFQDNARKVLLGAVVLTRYNHKTYRIDEILFDESPSSQFTCQGRDMSYVEYYRQQYGIEIHDHNQPLLLHRQERNESGSRKRQEMIICLVPEICYMTGLTDDMRNDFKVMREIATYTRVQPHQRLDSMRRFCANINANADARKLLSDWGLELVDESTKLVGRTLDHEKIQFDGGVVSAGVQADFSRGAMEQRMLEPVDILDWVLVYTQKDARYGKMFLENMQRYCRPTGVEIGMPQIVVLPEDRAPLYANVLRKQITPQTQIVVFICPSMREDRYSTIKRVACSEIPVPTQVVLTRTLSNEARNRAIVHKIILQMNCKVGGSLWGVKIPLQGTMICGIDTYHETKKGNDSVAALVASLDSTFTHWYSRATKQRTKEEMSNGLCASLLLALRAYETRNGELPGRIIIFRDGVGDDFLAVCEQYEIMQMQGAFAMVNSGYRPRLTYIVMQKRILTRFFALNQADKTVSNPPPGTILDHTVTRRHLYDYFLVSQTVRQGTVTPTHFVVVRDECDFRPDILQRLSYKLCFLYYNWPGSIRVPACCQYAHKLAYLVGQSVKREVDESLCDKLFYL
ncbi:protein argonaute-3 [Anopheles bellator]|uniref:protein argonaute-3 n=1 Tax=Anopheles bellator TaxID=139047 RepID=UPI00264825BC|nr:protein argonaute-3 [Anopheles bellator]